MPPTYDGPQVACFIQTIRCNICTGKLARQTGEFGTSVVKPWQNYNDTTSDSSTRGRVTDRWMSCGFGEGRRNTFMPSSGRVSALTGRRRRRYQDHAQSWQAEMRRCKTGRLEKNHHRAQTHVMYKTSSSLYTRTLMCTPNTVIHMSRTIGALRLGHTDVSKQVSKQVSN